MTSWCRETCFYLLYSDEYLYADNLFLVANINHKRQNPCKGRCWVGGIQHCDSARNLILLPTALQNYLLGVHGMYRSPMADQWPRQSRPSTIATPGCPRVEIRQSGGPAVAQTPCLRRSADIRSIDQQGNVDGLCSTVNPSHTLFWHMQSDPKR